MTHADYTTIGISSYTTRYLQENNRGSGPVWSLDVDSGGDTLVRQSPGLSGTGQYQVLTGAYVTWSNPPPHDTIIEAQPGYNDDGPPVQILLSSHVTATTLTAVMTPQPNFLGASNFAVLRLETVWDDDVTTLIEERSFIEGAPAYTVTLTLTDIRSGTSHHPIGIRLLTPYGPDPHLSHFLDEPFALGDVTIEFSNLHYDSGHMAVDYAITGGVLPPFDRVNLPLAHHLYGQETFGEMQATAVIMGDGPTSGTAPFIYYSTDPPVLLYEGDTDPEHYVFAVGREDYEYPYAAPIYAGYVGRYYISHTQVAQTPFTVTDDYDPITPVTLPHTTLFDWSQAVDTS